MSTLPYSGEHTCSLCSNKAYYHRDNELFCGKHCSKGASRTELPKNPHTKKLKTEEIKYYVEEARSATERNRSEGRPGAIVCCKLAMFKSPGFLGGYINIFPNYKHSGRKDGIGIPELSPKFMGPVPHGQPGLPPANTIESLHQENKVFPSEVGPDGWPLASFYEGQAQHYLDDEARRHKAEATGTGQARNVPVFSIWVSPDGVRHRLTYHQSRQFYCRWYEIIATGDPEEAGAPERWAHSRRAFRKLRDMLCGGANLRICGYDGRDLKGSPLEMYDDVSAPFGHELVLATLLVGERPYPWEVRMNSELWAF